MIEGVGDRLMKAGVVRAAVRRRRALSFDPLSSIGLESGLYGGRRTSLAPACSTPASAAGGVVDAEIVHHHQVPGVEAGH